MEKLTTVQHGDRYFSTVKFFSTNRKKKNDEYSDVNISPLESDI